MHRRNRVALFASIVGAVVSAVLAVTLTRFTDDNYTATTLIALAAPALYVTCVVVAFTLSNRSKHTLWLLVLAPYLEPVLIIIIWSIRGGMV